MSWAPREGLSRTRFPESPGTSTGGHLYRGCWNQIFDREAKALAARHRRSDVLTNFGLGIFLLVGGGFAAYLLATQSRFSILALICIGLGVAKVGQGFKALAGD